MKMSVIDDAALLKLAEAEILGETKRATIRHSTAGPSGWQPVPKANKSFLVNTLLQTLSSNRILSKKHRNMKTVERKLLQMDRKNPVSNNFTYKKPKSVSESKKKIKQKSKKKKRAKHDKKKKKSKMKK